MLFRDEPNESHYLIELNTKSFLFPHYTGRCGLPHKEEERRSKRLVEKGSDAPEGDWLSVQRGRERHASTPARISS